MVIPIGCLKDWEINLLIYNDNLYLLPKSSARNTGPTSEILSNPLAIAICL